MSIFFIYNYEAIKTCQSKQCILTLIMIHLNEYEIILLEQNNLKYLKNKFKSLQFRRNKFEFHVLYVCINLIFLFYNQFMFGD